MIVRMDPVDSIYTSIVALLSLVAPDRAILTTVRISVISKTDYRKSTSRDIHFLFEQSRGTYISVFWTSPKGSVVLPSQISRWVRSACNDGVQVVGHQGIGGPIGQVAEELLNELGGKDNCQDYEAEASWLLGQPRPVRITKLTRISKDPYDFRYKISIED